MSAALISGLSPAIVWRHFATLCSIPRASKAEARLRDALVARVKAWGQDYIIDAAGNLIVRKPATAGCEGWPGVVLQAHLDMVCQKNGDSSHDFSRDPICTTLQDGWLQAAQTTLGADNGIGVALILAVLESDDFPHGPLEALLTVDEEAGMGGARGLVPGLLHGRLMLNLDTEDWGEFFLGCAGGLDVDAQRSSLGEDVPAGWVMHEIALRGLRGGHSGVDIHEERGNAIKLLVRVLKALCNEFPLRVARLQGGTARNALPREAFATIALPDGQMVALEAALALQQGVLRGVLAGVDADVELVTKPAEAASVMPLAEQMIWLDSLHAAPHGVRRMSRQVSGVVETSNNLGVVEIGPDGGHCNLMVRSLVDTESVALADEIVSLFALSGTVAEKSGFYPGWAPNPASPLLAVCQSVFRREFGGESCVKVIHAGLECGIIGEKYPGMDIVSFGPTIRGAHAPGERVEVASVERCWHLLRAILAELR